MASLPSYEILVRWTVVDTTKWLAENGLSEYKDSFRKEGVDGSKLAKLTDSDIDNLKAAPTKKRIQLKNAVANIDRSRVNSLPKTQGMMNAFRQTKDVPSEPAPPPRPPRARQPLPHETEPPTSHAPVIPSGTNEYDDDNEDAYSWGDDFQYQSDSDDGDEDYINEKEWPQHDHNSKHDHNSNNIGFERQPTYEVVPNSDDDNDDEDYELPVSEPPVPARPPKPGQRSQPPPRKPVEPPPVDRPPPRPAALSRPQPPIPEDDDDEDVYDEPDEQKEKNEKERRRAEEKKRLTARQLPPVPSPSHETPTVPAPRRTPGQRPAIPKLPPEPEETYEPMDAPQKTTPSRVPDPPKASKSKPQPTQRSSRPLPNVPPPTDPPVKKVRNAAVPAPQQRDELDRYEWYHKNIDRTNAESSLMDQKEDGMYLIRKSKRGGTEQQYTLTIYKQGRVYNLPIRKRNRDGKFALGAEKPNELDFDSVPSLVDYFKTKLIMLNPKAKNASGSTRLVIAMQK